MISEMTFEFSLKVIELYQTLVQKKEYVISKQLLKSATSIGANVHEATAAQSRNDFISKMSIASKEARETKYWLRLLEKSNIAKSDYSEFLIKVDQIINVLTRIVKTTQQNNFPSNKK